MEALDLWVSLHGEGIYMEPDFVPLVNYGLHKEYGMQQIRSEILEFANMLSERKYSSILEVGLGYFGSSHFLWREIFSKVITIEWSNDRVMEFGRNMLKFYNGHRALDDGKSSFIIGSSYDPITVSKTHEFLKDGVDVLFIDADHKYESVLMDYLLYSPLVKKNGIIALHDISAELPIYFGVPRLIRELEAKGIKFSKIIHSKSVGIGYYIVE